MRTLIAALAGVLIVGSPALAQDGGGKPEPVRRPGSVDLHETYDMSDLRIPEDEMHTLLPRDAIPALTDPELEAGHEADWLTAEDRVIVVKWQDDVVAAPLRILNWHEVANLTVGKRPLAATYCPLCDSATVIDRRVGDRTLEFGVSGALYNSNVLMYDRTDMGLWSQLGMRAVSGTMAGTTLTHLPARVVTWGAFRLEFPSGRVISKETGHQRNYKNPNPYKGFFDAPDRLLVPVQGVGDELPKKTLGVGVATDGGSWFIPENVIGDDGFTLETDAGEIRLSRSEAGVAVDHAPEGARTAQTFYYSWSAFNPDTVVAGVE